MHFSTASAVAVGILLLPCASLAAPANISEAADLYQRDAGDADELVPHHNCYNSGLMFKYAGSSGEVDAAVRNGCSWLESYDGHEFRTLEKIKWCVNMDDEGPSLVMSMKYKGYDETFTPWAKNYDGGLTSYCQKAVEWIRDNCERGGVFKNHELGSDVTGRQYWDVTLDPNSDECDTW